MAHIQNPVPINHLQGFTDKFKQKKFVVDSQKTKKLEI